MEVEDGGDGASAGRGEGGDDAPAADAGPSEHAAAPAPASASAIAAMVLAVCDAARAEEKRGRDQAFPAVWRERPMRSLTPRSRLKMTKYLDAGDQ